MIWQWPFEFLNLLHAKLFKWLVLLVYLHIRSLIIVYSEWNMYAAIIFVVYLVLIVTKDWFIAINIHVFSEAAIKYGIYLFYLIPITCMGYTSSLQFFYAWWSLICVWILYYEFWCNWYIVGICCWYLHSFFINITLSLFKNC